MVKISNPFPQRLLFFILLFTCNQVIAVVECGFSVPEGWKQANTRWDGECVAGKAEGLGVLKEFENRKAKRFFFGRLVEGQIQQGVIDQAEGYVAGQFKRGVLVPSEDRQVFIDSFRLAEQAASLVASRFRKVGNKASAQYYETKQKQLEQQMD
jgi:hypothetical protein